MPATRAVTTDFYETAPIRYRATRLVAATPDEVFEVLADTDGWPRWFPGVTSASWTSEPPHGVGSTRTVKVGAVAIEEQFLVWDPGRAWGFTFTATTIPLVRAAAELVELRPDGTGTQVTYDLHVDPLPIVGITARMVRGQVERGLGRGLRGLERHLQAG